MSCIDRSMRNGSAVTRVPGVEAGSPQPSSHVEFVKNPPSSSLSRIVIVVLARHASSLSGPRFAAAPRLPVVGPLRARTDPPPEAELRAHFPTK